MKHIKAAWGKIAVVSVAFAAGAALPAMADAVRVYDVDDYVQDDMVLHFDGIRNNGADAAHDPTTRTWKNLVDGQPDAAFDASYHGYWTNSLGFFFEGYNRSGYAQISSPITLGPNMTVQIVVDVDPSLQAGGQQGAYRNTTYFHSGTGDYNFGIYTSNTKSEGAAPSSELSFTSDNYYGPRTPISSWNGKYATLVIKEDAGKADGFAGSLADSANLGVSYTTKHNFANGRPLQYCWGGSKNMTQGRAVLGTYYAVRVYTNALSEAQIEKNMTVDEARFRNADTVGKTPNVIVASDTDGVDGVEPSGKYHVSGTFTFTARPAVAGGVGYACAGYSIETWDGSAWSAAVTNSGVTSYTHNAATQPAKVRLTWIWARQATIRTAADYDVDDYVQDDLVLHFDGIRNNGAGVAHDPTASTWKNLVDGQPDAAFSYTYNGYWTNSLGYFFMGQSKPSCAQITNAITLGPNLTVQIAVDINPSLQAGGEQGENRITTYFHSGVGGSSDFGVFTYNTGSGVPVSELSFKSDNYYLPRMPIYSWNGKYATLVIKEDAGKTDGFAVSLTDSANLGESYSTRHNMAKDTPFQYCWGGSKQMETGRAVLGTYYAVRVYTNALSEAQIAKNMRIDDIRFRDIGDVTVVNGAIEGTSSCGESSMPDGTYNVESGSWTFTAEKVVVGRMRRFPHLRVETWDGSGWKVSSKHEESYTYTAGDGRVRLTWTWVPPIGMVIYFR